MPVRKLLEKAGGMIKQIKPCFMMSPLSIAQYLDPTNEELQFDVVIFDEASQVKPEDALGAFMRGKTAVVMGDTQQLPPTSFFDQMSDADSDEEEATSLDMESILHLCKLSFPVKMLKWHYRSRHESLIAVSNREFYDDDLLVYPSPSHSDPELGLKFHYNPNTQYLRGASSKNPLEAKDVVEEIFNHFEKYGDTKSLGVGTFSVAQKNAILEELEVKRKEHPEYEPLFSENKDERFFVKNLETIQGDERDVILISVGYGYDQDGKMSLNFGPLNQDGGERRLNVLITRAREKCVVFSNFKAYDMNLTANPPYGVKSLKEFLEYAENLTLGTHGVDEYSKEPFEDAIASFLEENGYTVDRQIGCAGFRVDLAIVDDENPGKYILGITTDGKMYASSKVARDRDRLREQVLTGLGWKLYHLWSTDWYRNRDLGRKKLLDFVEKSIRETREEEKRRSEEEKRLAEKRRLEAEKKAEELRIAREKEEAERKAKEEAESDEIDPEDIGPEDFVEVEKVGDDILEKPIDVSELDPDEFFKEVSAEEVESSNKSLNENSDSKTESEFVEVKPSNESKDYSGDESESEFVEVDSSSEPKDYSSEVSESEFVEVEKDADEPFDDNDDGIDNTNDYDNSVESSINEEKINVSSSKDDDSLDEINEVEIDQTSHETSKDNESENQNDDAEVWEMEDEVSSNENDDAEVWESDEGVSPEDNAEVWEDDTDYSDEEKHHSVKDRIKSIFTPKSVLEDTEHENKGSSLFGGLKFNKDLGENSDLDDELKEESQNIDESPQEETVDLGSDDDYIYVDHSNDEVSDVEDSKVQFDKKLDETVEEEIGDIPFEEPVSVDEVKKSVEDSSNVKEDTENVVGTVRDESVKKSVGNASKVKDDKVDFEDGVEEVYQTDDVKKSVKDSSNVKDELEDISKTTSPVDEDIVDLGSDDDYIYVDHSNDEPIEHNDNVGEVSDTAQAVDEDIVDLGSDDDVHVDNIDDESHSVEANEDKDVSENQVVEKHKHKRNNFVKSIISDVVAGETQLQPKEIKTVKGEFIDDDVQLHKPAPKDDLVVEAEIVDDNELNAINDNFTDWDEQNNEELNIFNDNLPDWDNDDSNIFDIVDDAKKDYIDETFDEVEIDGDRKVFDLGDNESIEENNIDDSNIDSEPQKAMDDERVIQDNEDTLENDNKVVEESIPDDGVTYYQGSNDVTSKLRKNNFYYDDEKPRSVKESIKGIKKDMKYINKSLKEIENPTKIDYVSVVDRTEEYDPADYLNMPSDDDSDRIIEMEEELTFAEKEEIRIEKEMKMEALQKEIESDENVIVPVHEQYGSEEQKDQALEDIIQSADEDYKEIEKERHNQENQLKAFDNHKLPGKKKLEDNIVDYVQSTDIGLNSSDDLYKKPINNVSDSIKLIVDIEGPIHVDEVTKRIKESCHIKRAGSNLKKTVNAAIDNAESSGKIIKIGDFLYDASNNDVLIRKRNKPNIDLISDEEIAKSIELVLTYNPNIKTKQIAKETSRNFGFKSTSKKTATRINSVLDLMIANNRVKIENDNVELK